MRYGSSPSKLNPTASVGGAAEARASGPGGMASATDRTTAIQPICRRSEPYMCKFCTAREVGPCSWLEHDEKRDLLTSGSRRRLAARETLFLTGDQSHSVYVVSTGMLKIYRSMPDGRSQIVGLALPGDLLGSLLHDRHLLSAEAIGRAEVCEMSRAALQKLLDRREGLRDRFVGLVYDSLAAAYDHMLLLGRMNATERLGSLLLRLAERAEIMGGSTTPLYLTMRRRDMADFLGLSLETVSRSFGQLANNGIIRLAGPSKVFIRDRSRLKQIAHTD